MITIHRYKVFGTKLIGISPVEKAQNLIVGITHIYNGPPLRIVQKLDTQL